MRIAKDAQPIAIMAMSSMDGSPATRLARGRFSQQGVRSILGADVFGLRGIGNDPTRGEEQKVDGLSEKQRTTDEIENDIQHDSASCL
jgi:hypothetical protein